MTGANIADRVRTPRAHLLGLIVVVLGGAGLVAGVALHVIRHDAAGHCLLASLVAVTVGMGCLAAGVPHVRGRGRGDAR